VCGYKREQSALNVSRLIAHAAAIPNLKLEQPKVSIQASF
jgi:hypothetical protein